MSHIHYRVRNGKPTYRLWSTICDAYLTNDLTYDELRTELRIEAIRAALSEVDGLNLERRMQRVHANGSSDGLGSPVPLDGPWMEERNDDDDDEPETPE